MQASFVGLGEAFDIRDEDYRVVFVGEVLDRRRCQQLLAAHAAKLAPVPQIHVKSRILQILNENLKRSFLGFLTRNRHRVESQRIDHQSLIFVRRERDLIFRILDQRDRFVRNLALGRLMFFAADIDKVFFLRDEVSRFLLFRKMEPRLHTEDSRQRFVDTRFRKDSVRDRFLDVLRVFVFVAVIQEHVAAAGDRDRNHQLALHLGCHTHHMARIGYDESVKSEPVAQQILKQFRRECRRHDIFVLDARAQLAAVGRLLDMADHDRLYARIDHSLINFSV